MNSLIPLICMTAGAAASDFDRHYDVSLGFWLMMTILAGWGVAVRAWSL